MGNIFTKNLRMVKISLIKRNPDQPRKYFDAQSLEELKQSIITHGIINPISVKKIDESYQIIAGERRYRAAVLAGLREIPCVVLSSDDEKCALISLVENIQRCDLDFVEEAVSYKKIIDNFGLKQEDFANSIGKTQSSVANKLRILKLHPELLIKMREHSLTERHARAMLKLPEDKRFSALEQIIKNNFNVAKTEQYIEELLLEKSEKEKAKYFKVVRDVRLFINTINKSVKLMQESGVDAKVSKKNDENFMTYTIIIPMKQ
ncbi:MAG: ParB/RepB/Spo0J family partition protein [Clostridia bacterium]